MILLQLYNNFILILQIELFYYIFNNKNLYFINNGLVLIQLISFKATSFSKSFIKNNSSTSF